MTNPKVSPIPRSLDNLLADTPEQFTLDNGLTVVFHHNAAHRVISTQAWIRTGSIHENKYLGSGLSHFLEHMLFKGSESMKPGEVATKVQAFGGQINAYTSFDRTVYYIDGPSEAFHTSLELLSEMVFRSILPEEEVTKEREVILREIDMTLDDPDRILSRSLFRTAYRMHPFRYPVIGIRSLFEGIQRNTLWDYYKARYQPENVVLSIAGDVDRDTLMKGLETTFATIPRKSLEPVILPEEKPQLALREIRQYGDYQTARGYLAYKIPSMRHQDAPALSIIAAIIGSGHSSRFRQELREERNLVHEVNASSWNPADPGLFSVRYLTDSDRATQAEEAIIEACDNLRNHPFKELELEKARQFACLSEIQARKTCSGMASRQGLIAALIGDLDYPKRYFQKLYGLSTDDLMAVTEKTFVRDRLTISSLQPEALRKTSDNSSGADTLPDFQQKTLENGARIIWQRDSRLPRTWMRLIGLGGCMYESPEERGATSLLATLLCRDTHSRSARQVADELETKGGFMIDGCGNNSFSLSVEVPPESALFALNTLQEAAMYPAFKPETVEREKEAQVSHLRQMEDEIFDYGRLAMRKKFFGDHPFASDPSGNPETVEKLTPKHLEQLHKKLVVAGNCILVITGEFDESLLAQAEAFLEKLPASAFKQQSIPFKSPSIQGLVREHMDREQAVLFESYPDVGFMPENEIIPEILTELLSDMSGPLFKAVREDRSLAYYVGASRLLGHDYGAFYLYAGTHPTTTDETFSCFDSELDRIRNGQLTEEELEVTKTRLKMETRFNLQSPSSRASRVALNALFNKPLMDWVDYESKLEKISVQEVIEFAREHLCKKNRMRLVVAPETD